MTRLVTPARLLAALMAVALPVQAQNVRLKIATLAPEGSVWLNQAQAAAATIGERTAGRVTFRFYPGGTMGDDPTVLRKMRIGQLQGGAVLAGGLAGVYPDTELYNLPLLLRSYDEVDYVRARIDEVIIAGLLSNGLVSFGLIETGFVYLMSNRPVASFDDLQGRKAWIPEGDEVSVAIVRAAGLSPVPLPISDVLTGLQTGLVDAVAAPPVGAVALQWFTKAKYVTDLPVTYIYGTLLVSERAFAAISPADQAIARDELGRMSKTLDHSSRIDNQQAREALVKQGVSFIVPTAETRSRWDRVAAEATRDLLAKGSYTAELYSQITRLLDQFRSERRPAAAD